VTSRKPIGPALAQCLKPIDEFIAWLKPTTAKYDKSGFMYVMLSVRLKAKLAYDWGAPNQTKAKAMRDMRLQWMSDNAGQFGDNAEQLKHAKEVAVSSGGAVKGITDAILALRESMSRLDDVELQDNAAMLAYTQCIIDNKVPATNDNW
jgi:hypothetical protein